MDSESAHLKIFCSDDFPLLHPILVREEPFGKSVTLNQMHVIFAGHEGWTIWSGNRLVGAITLSNFRMLHSVVVHAVVDRELHGRWATRRILKQMFNYVFGDNYLCLHKLYAFAIPHHTYQAAKLLTDLGFTVWGVDKCGGVAPDGSHYDVINYELLREDCKWIRH
jgi:RimJ/RimL family protein N-acetyltransferase